MISRIIKENRDSMINDIDVLTKDDQQLRQDAFCRCINVRLNEKYVVKKMYFEVLKWVKRMNVYVRVCMSARTCVCKVY